MRFAALDVETANADMSSICQVGIAEFDCGKVVDEWNSLVNPKTYFNGMNVAIHGIDEAAVQGAPTFADIGQTVKDRLHDRVVVTHTHFDRACMHQVFERSSLSQPDCRWLDTARVARRAWTEFEGKGYGLANVCKTIGYAFRHHDALEDAKAAGHILLAACEHTGLDVDDWLSRITQPIDPDRMSSGKAVERQGNPEGPLFGETIVFTGALQITRREAADLAARIGCSVAQGVTKKTTILCVGDQDVERLAGHSKSSKHRKAEALIANGQPIRVIRETDFVKMTGLD